MQKKRRRKLKGGVLFYAIVLSLIIAIFTSSFILYSFFNKKEFDAMIIIQKVQANALSAINIALVPNTITPGSKETIDLFGAGSDSVTIEKTTWGAFEIVVAKAYTGGCKFSKSALIGAQPQQDHSFALYLADRDRPLNLAGNTVLNGTCYLPKSGVKRAYIEGASFTGTIPSEKDFKISNKEIPAIQKELLSQLINRNTSASLSDSIIEYESLNDSLINSFSSQILYVYCNGNTTIDNKTLAGKIVLISEGKINIKASASIHDILIYAPSIIFEEGFQGSLQAFASDSLVMQKNCILNYPSVLGIFRDAKSKDNISLILEEGAGISGSLIGYEESKAQNKNLNISIRQGAVVKGSVYSNGSVDLKGTVYGSVTTNTLLLYTASSVYENHLLNATIDPSKLSPFFVGASLTSETGLRKIIKWL